MAAWVAISDPQSMITYYRYIKIGMKRAQHITEDSVMVTYRTLEKWMRIMSAHCLGRIMCAHCPGRIMCAHCLGAYGFKLTFWLQYCCVVYPQDKKYKDIISTDHWVHIDGGDSLFLRDQLNKSLPTSSPYYRRRSKFWNFVPCRVVLCDTTLKTRSSWYFEGTIILWKIRNNLSNNTASHSAICQSSATVQSCVACCSEYRTINKVQRLSTTKL